VPSSLVPLVDLFATTRQVLRLAPTAVALPLRRGWYFGGRRFDRRRDLGFGRFYLVEEGRAFDPLAAAAEGDLHEAMRAAGLRFGDLWSEDSLVQRNRALQLHQQILE
jgi:hypothetical protein